MCVIETTTVIVAMAVVLTIVIITPSRRAILDYTYN